MEYKDIIATLDSASDGFESIANKEQKKIYDEVVTLAKDLETDANGNVKQSIGNLKRLTLIKAKLAKLSKDKEWAAGISGFAEYFGKLQMMQNKYFTEKFPEHCLPVNYQKKNQIIKEMAVQNTMEALMGDGLKANVTDKLNDILLRAVTTGAKFADLQEELRGHLMGQNGGQGAFARYATTYATTALSQYTGQHNKLFTDDIGLEWFMYIGSNKETTREFCEHLTKKKYVHKSEIPTILAGKIDDYQCAIYEKTGLPYGMIAGTTPDNFQCNCGGWNCRHQLVPVHELAVPQEIRDRIKKTAPQGDDISQEKGKDAFYALLNKNGWDKFSIDMTMKDFDTYGVKFEYTEDMTASQIMRNFNDAQTKMSNAQIELHQKWQSLESLWSVLHSNYPDKFSDVADFYKKNKSEVDAIINLGYAETKQWISKTRKRIEGSIDRMADIESPKGDGSANSYNKGKLAKGAKQLGAKLESPMNFSKADNGNVNPENLHNNCQRCALTFEMRCRGLDVSAGNRPEKNDAFFAGLGNNVMGDLIWINTKTKKPPTKYAVRRKTFTETRDAFNNATKQPGRYILYCAWAKRGAHNFNFIRNSSGAGFFYDGQKNYSKNLEYYFSNTDRYDWSLSVWRVDDCDLEERYYTAAGIFKIKED